MNSELTKQIEHLSYRLKEIECIEHTKAYNAVLDLARLVLELSMKLDRQELDEE